jgi:hypothetical protein
LSSLSRASRVCRFKSAVIVHPLSLLPGLSPLAHENQAITTHTTDCFSCKDSLGDLYVSFAMQQSYARRAAAQGSKLLVQRAQRGAAHCDFTVAEQVASFDALAKWGQGGAKPAGDDVLTAAVVAAPSYGYAFTNNTTGPDDVKSTIDLRAKIAATTPACPVAVQ